MKIGGVELELTRRNVLLGAGAAALGAVALAKPGNMGAPHSEYFTNLQNTAKKGGIIKPTMMIDLDRLDQNIDLVTRSVKAPKTYRIVVKSLPAYGLIDYVMARAETKSLMVFHQPFISHMARHRPDADLLLGKPMPVAGAKQFYESFAGGGFDPSQQLHWLIDTPLRLAQYQYLAHSLGTPLNVSIELDVGLHRGGVSDASVLRDMLAMIDADPDHLILGGLMGYEPHIPGVPNPESAKKKAWAIYQEMKDVAASHRGNLNGLILNGAGSPTYRLYEDSNLINDVSVGSALVKPTHFDTKLLEPHVPASFIATPVLKALHKTDVPSIEFLTGLSNAWNPNLDRAYYIYGGYWKAEPVSPAGLRNNGLMGHSTNQELFNGSDRTGLDVDDFVFLRPTQSEFVFLQFGDLVAYRSNKVEARWPVLENEII